MKYSCKNCGKDFTSAINQVMINDWILSGKTYIHSDGTKAEYKEVSTSCNCKLTVSRHKINTNKCR